MILTVATRRTANPTPFAPAGPAPASSPSSSPPAAPEALATTPPRGRPGAPAPRGTPIATLARTVLPMLVAQATGATSTSTSTPASVKDGGDFVPLTGNGTVTDGPGGHHANTGTVVGVAAAVGTVAVAVLVGLHVSNRRKRRAEAEDQGAELATVDPALDAPPAAHLGARPPAYEDIVRTA